MEISDSDLRFIINKRAEEVQKLVSQGKLKEALLESLRSPPVGAKDQSIKDDNSKTVVNVLAAVKETDIEKTISDLSSDQQDNIMKFVYKGFEFGDQSTILLKWHEVLLKNGGLGVIIRSLSDRKTT
eukprot:TRINITY_DN13252_c0_g1_i1.p1 TRINITY_DN13252_c0_g1~~TRINITY_DN13252_c0_g1_i1.p1  ORF type:complete len:137 (+),score=36.46 TRINITY_DN13252_c0_g1_i1:32-412(+)